MAAVLPKNDVFWIFALEGRVGPGRDSKIRDPRKDLHSIGFSKH